jgi:hypothetical protein
VTTPWGSEFSFSATTLLAGVALLLLVFVSGGVIYLSSIEWRDRRRRQATSAGNRR